MKPPTLEKIYKLLDTRIETINKRTKIQGIEIRNILKILKGGKDNEN